MSRRLRYVPFLWSFRLPTRSKRRASDHRFQLPPPAPSRASHESRPETTTSNPAVNSSCVARSTSTIFSMRKLLSGSGPAGAGPDSPGSCDDEHSQGASSFLSRALHPPRTPPPPFTQISRHYRFPAANSLAAASWIARRNISMRPESVGSVLRARSLHWRTRSALEVIFEPLLEVAHTT